MHSNMITNSCPLAHGLVHAVTAFGRLLRDMGFSVSPAAIMTALEGVLVVGIHNLDDFKVALKSALLTRPEEVEIFDRLFTEFWMDTLLRENLNQDKAQLPESQQNLPKDNEGDEMGMAEAVLSESQERDALRAQPFVIYSPKETLRHQDFKDLVQEDDKRVQGLIREILAPLLKRRSLHHRPVTTGTAVDFRRLFRLNVKYRGELFEVPWLKPRRRAKKLVFLCDVSGSMSPYLRFILQFIRGLQHSNTKVETFVFATKLSRITQLLRNQPFSRAMIAVAEMVHDWGGGTRIGQCLQDFTDTYGTSMVGASTVVLIHSDGWDRGDPLLLHRQMSRIRSKAYRVVWINPLLGSSGYEPTCRGMKTALPLTDFFLPGRNLAALERLAGTIRSLC